MHKVIAGQTRRRIIYSIILLVGLFWIFISADRAGTATNGQIPAPQAGFLAPDFELKSLTGETVKLADLRGQAVLVNLWATWCPPCREEMPALEKMYNEYSDQGFIVLGVNMTRQDDAQAVGPFVEKYRITFPILLDENGNMGNAYQMKSLPSSYFVNRDGVITEVVIGGPMAEALLRTRIEQILK